MFILLLLIDYSLFYVLIENKIVLKLKKYLFNPKYFIKYRDPILVNCFLYIFSKWYRSYANKMMFIHITYEISLLISWNSIGLTYDFSTKFLETLETKSKDITVPSDGTEPSADITVPSAATEHSADITVPNTDTERCVQCFDKSLENNRSIYKILAVTGIFLGGLLFVYVQTYPNILFFDVFSPLNEQVQVPYRGNRLYNHIPTHLYQFFPRRFFLKSRNFDR